MRANIKRKIAAGLSVIILLTAHCVSFGAENTSTVPEVLYTKETKTVEIKGNTALPNTMVTIEILCQGKTEKDLQDGKFNTDETVRFYAQESSDDNGVWKKRFIFGEDKGVFLVRVYLSGEDKVYTDKLYLNIEKVKEIIAEINANRADSNSVRKIIEDNIDWLALDNDVYRELKGNGTDLMQAYTNIANDAPFGEGDITKDDIALFETSFEKNMLVTAFNSNIAVETKQMFLEEYPELLGISDETIYLDYLKLTDRTAVCNMLSGSGYGTVEEIASDFVENAVAYILINTAEWNRIAVLAQGYQTEYRERIPELDGIDFAAYNGLSGERKYNAMNELIADKSSVSSLEQWVKRFNAVCLKWKSATLPSSGSGSGGGGGGSSSSGNTLGSVIASPVIGNTATSGMPALQQTGFGDIDTAPWAKEAILYLTDKGVVSGRSKAFFDTESNVTREEFIKMIVLAFGLMDNSEYTCSFNDVERDAWYYSYVACGERKGITQGNEDGSFGVGRSITREEMAAMLMRTIGVIGNELEPVKDKFDFADYDNISSWAREAVELLQTAGIVEGMENGMYMPKGNTTRAQAATVVYRILRTQ